MTTQQPQSFGFLLVPGFSLMSFTAGIEPLRAANQLSGKTLYSWKLYSSDGSNACSKHNIEIVVDSGLENAADVDYLFVVAGEGAHAVTDSATLHWLRQAAKRQIIIGAVSSGPFILANAGLLKGYRCTIHWDDMPAFVEAFPELETSYSLFEIDRDRFTSSGGTSAIDMVLQLIGDQHGTELAARVAVFFQHDRLRTPEDQQQLAERLALTRKSPKLSEAVRLMTINIEEPIKPVDIAQQIGLSLRQLERLCHKYCHCTPQKIYMRIRLQHARSILLETGLTVMQVAIATGFTTQSHFTKCFRDQYATTPQKLRTLSR